MGSYLFIGTTPMDFPSEGGGIIPSFTVQPGEHIEAVGWIPDPRYFDPINGAGPADANLTEE